MDGFPINITDIVIIGVLLISGIFAFVRGFVHELLAIGAWIAAGVATAFALPPVLPYARQLISIQIVADIVAGVAIFLAVLIAFSIFTHWLSRRVRESSLGALDRSLGLLYGFARGAVIICVAWLLLLWGLPRQDHPAWITEARALPLVEQGAEFLVSLVPGDLLPEIPDAGGGPSLSPEKTFQELIRPGGSGEAAPDAKEAGSAERSGYKDRERNQLQRLIDSSQ